MSKQRGLHGHEVGPKFSSSKGLLISRAWFQTTKTRSPVFLQNLVWAALWQTKRLFITPYRKWINKSWTTKKYANIIICLKPSANSWNLYAQLMILLSAKFQELMRFKSSYFDCHHWGIVTFSGLSATFWLWGEYLNFRTEICLLL